jgi:hypothetical protein
LLTSQQHRRLLWRPGFWIMIAVAGLMCLPILVWNSQNNWVTFKHVSGLAGINRPAQQINGLGPFVYLGSQFGLLLGFWFVVWMMAMAAHRPWREPDAGLRYLWWLSAPMFLVFLGFSLKTGGGEVNWPVAAYLSGLVLTAGWLARQVGATRAWYRLFVAGTWTATCGLGAVLVLLLHYPQSAYPALGVLADRFFPGEPLALRRFDPSCRLQGWQTLAGEVDRLREQLRSEGTEPVLAGAGWNIPGELGFYCRGNPTVYSLGLAVGDRHSQYDLWRPNPVPDPEEFFGRTFIVVGFLPAAAQSAFEHVEPPIAVTHLAAGRAVNAWAVTVCRGFRGFSALPTGTKH